MMGAKCRMGAQSPAIITSVMGDVGFESGFFSEEGRVMVPVSQFIKGSVINLVVLLSMGISGGHSPGEE